MWAVQQVFLKRSNYHFVLLTIFHIISVCKRSRCRQDAAACDGEAVKDLDFKKNIEERYQIESTKIGEGGNEH